MAEKTLFPSQLTVLYFATFGLGLFVRIVLLHDATLDQEPDTGLCLLVNRKFVGVLPEVVGDSVFPLWYMQYFVHVS